MRFQYPQRFEALQPLVATPAAAVDGWLFTQAPQQKAQARPQPDATVQTLIPITVALASLDWLTIVSQPNRPQARPQPTESPFLAISTPAKLDWLSPPAQQNKPQARTQTPETAPVYVRPKFDWNRPEARPPRAQGHQQPVEVPFVFRQALMDCYPQETVQPKAARQIQPIDTPLLRVAPILARIEWLFQQPYLRRPPWSPHTGTQFALVEFSVPAGIITNAGRSPTRS
ncbi:MAG: hypothetical protein JWN86_424 [Planctomycetota bacterium]|nr:hypothetical protein [Planctomycetota bacterium]